MIKDDGQKKRFICPGRCYHFMVRGDSTTINRLEQRTQMSSRLRQFADEISSALLPNGRGLETSSTDIAVSIN